MATLTAGTTTSAFGINGFGQRITKAGSSVPSGGTNEFVYDEQGNMLGEYGSTGTMIEETAFLPDTPVSVLSKGFGIAGLSDATPVVVFTGSAGATVSSVTADQLGAPHIITNASKQYLWTWNPYAFGDNAPNQNPAGLGTDIYNPRFRGQYKDVESNTNYNYFRDCYNPLLGRYCQSDPIGLGGGINTYAYVNVNPLSFTDSKGLLIDINDPRGYEAVPSSIPGYSAPCPPNENAFNDKCSNKPIQNGGQATVDGTSWTRSTWSDESFFHNGFHVYKEAHADQQWGSECAYDSTTGLLVPDNVLGHGTADYWNDSSPQHAFFDPGGPRAIPRWYRKYWSEHPAPPGFY
jgi:RHS repeat-associated protein